MAVYPVEIRRCSHIRTNGTQCGSPALKEKEFCYYHDENRTVPVDICLDGEKSAGSQIMIPPFEDAHSIQKVLRHVVQLLFERRIERKDAGLALYALQIASSNLRTMQEEKARPTQVVVEPEKVAETPMGMTPWSAKGKGHDIEEPADMAAERALREVNEWWAERYRRERQWMLEELRRIDKWWNGNPDRDQALDLIDSVRKNLEHGAEVMEDRLAEGLELARLEAEVVGSAG